MEVNVSTLGYTKEIAFELMGKSGPTKVSLSSRMYYFLLLP